MLALPFDPVPPRFSNIRKSEIKPDEETGSYLNRVTIDWEDTTQEPVSVQVQVDEPDYAVYNADFLQKNAIVGLDFRVTFEEGTEIHPENILNYDADQIFLKSYVFGDGDPSWNQEKDCGLECDRKSLVMKESVELEMILKGTINTGLEVIFQNCLGDQNDPNECWEFMKGVQGKQAFLFIIMFVHAFCLVLAVLIRGCERRR